MNNISFKLTERVSKMRSTVTAGFHSFQLKRSVSIPDNIRQFLVIQENGTTPIVDQEN